MGLIGNQNLLKFNYIYIFLILALIEVQKYTVGLIPYYPPIIDYFLIYLILFGLFFQSININLNEKISSNSKKIFLVYWLYSLIVIIIGLYDSTSYWDYKYIFLNQVPYVMLSFSIFIGINFEKNRYFFIFLIKKLFPIILLLSIFFYDNNYSIISVLAIPLVIFILSFFYLNKKTKVLIVTLSLVVLFVDFNYRTNSLRIILCYLSIFLLYFFRYKQSILNTLTIIIILIPLYLLFLGMDGSFDVFTHLSNKIDLYYENSTYGFGSNTRTFLYVDVLNSIIEKNSNIFFGDGASAGYQTRYFVDQIFSEKGRLSSEVGFLNTLLKSGILGVMLYFLILIYPAYLAINFSKNKLSKNLGFFLVLNWVLFFIEVYQTINITNFVNFIIIGLCISNNFRKLSDEEIKSFFNN